MRADKLRVWLQRQRVGAHRVLLQHGDAGEERETFATFPAEPTPDVQLIFDACADLADSLEESVRVAIVIQGEEGELIAQTFHKQTPLEAASVDALNASEVSGNSIIAQLLRHIESQQRAVTGSHISIYDAFERTLARLEKVTERQNLQITSLTEALRNVQETSTVETEEARDESIARTAAWEKLAEIGPIVAEFALKAANAKMNGANGHVSGAVHGAASVVD